jgi:hypothetical protein
VVRIVHCGANLILDIGKAFVSFLAKLFFIHRRQRLDSEPITSSSSDAEPASPACSGSDDPPTRSHEHRNP